MKTHSPSTIILDTGDFIRSFREFVTHNGRNYWFVEDMVQEVLHCIQYRPIAEERLNNFATEIIHDVAEYEEGYIEDFFAEPIVKLGMLLVDLLDRSGIYEVDGTLLYRISVSSNQNLNEVILKKKTLYELLQSGI